MLKRKHRLAKTKDVKQTFARGRGFFYPYFTLKYAKSGILLPRFTVVVSTKVSKKAVERNRIKRVIREYIRTHLSGFVSGNYAIIVKPIASKLENKDIVKSLEVLTKEPKIYTHVKNTK